MWHVETFTSIRPPACLTLQTHLAEVERRRYNHGSQFVWAASKVPRSLGEGAHGSAAFASSGPGYPCATPWDFPEVILQNGTPSLELENG